MRYGHGNIIVYILFLKICGWEAYVKHLMCSKVNLKSNKCFIIGYPWKTKRYYIYNQKEGKVLVA
jgi:hypothetical protein